MVILLYALIIMNESLDIKIKKIKIYILRKIILQLETNLDFDCASTLIMIYICVCVCVCVIIKIHTIEHYILMLNLSHNWFLAFSVIKLNIKSYNKYK